jgi:hypothetical protein
MISVFANPELVRNRRAQLRRSRVLACIVVTGVLSIVVGYVLAYESRQSGRVWGEALLTAALWTQAAALVFGGGMACSQAIQREREANTFDFQRLTRLTSLELTVGKWLGAPATAYLITACLLPAAIVGAWAAGISVARLALAYAVLLIGGVCFHAFALLLSLVTSRSGVGLVIFLIVLAGAESVPAMIGMGSLSPFAVTEIVEGPQRFTAAPAPSEERRHASGVDTFFGRQVPHAAAMVAVWGVFAGWFLLATARNIKRDPAAWELFTPAQALGLAFCVDLLIVGFHSWDPRRAVSTMRIYLVANTYLFFLIGLLLIRSRDRSRRLRLAHQGFVTRREWLWPVPYVFLGATVAGIAIAVLAASTDGLSPVEIWFGIFAAVLAALIAVRDVAYLQWMNVRRGRYPLPMGLVYMFVFYVCVLLIAATMWGTREGEAVQGALAPWGVAALSVHNWRQLWWAWVLVVFAQVAATAFFTRQHRKVLAAL